MAAGWSRIRAGAVLLSVAAGTASAQEPTFKFSKPEAGTGPAWTATAQLGLTAATGNSEAVGVSATAAASRRVSHTRVSAEARGAFARSQLQVATESDGTPGIGPSEIDRIARTTTEAWDVRARLDRYFGARDAVYVSAGAGGDRPAGRRLTGGGQVGYAKALVLTEAHELTVELGYDVSHHDFVTAARSLTSHSARAFAGYQLKPTAAVAFRLSLDVLGNLAPETSATRHVPALHHERLLGRAEVDLKVTEKGSLGLRMRARYDSVPAPRPPFPGLAYEAGFTPLAERLDTSTELVFVHALL